MGRSLIRWLRVLACIACSAPAWAGGGGPDSLGYRWLDSNEPDGPVYSWTEIRLIGTSPGSGDDNTWKVPLPHPFTFYGTEYDSLYICTNGFISFTSRDSNPYPAQLPNSNSPNAMVAPFWSDLLDQNGCLLYYHDQPKDRFIVEWDSVTHWDGNNLYSFQAVLDFHDNSLEFQYKKSDPDWQISASAAGIENQSGTAGLGIDRDSIRNDYAVRFFHLPDTHDVKAIEIEQPGWFVNPASPITCQLRIANLGLATESFPAECSIFRHDSLIFADTATVADLAPGDSLTVSFATWISGNPGEQYTLKMCCALDDDRIRSNDSISAQSISFSYQDKLSSAWRESMITIDGQLVMGEWPESARIDISDILSQCGQAPPPGSAFLYAANDSSRLYLAADITWDIGLENNDALYLYIDDDGDGTWSSDDGEGQYNLVLARGNDSLFYTAFPSYNVLAHSGILYAIGSSSGHVQHELSIPLGSGQLWDIGNQPGGTCGLHCKWKNGSDASIIGWWPQVMGQSQDDQPAHYGTLALASSSNGVENFQPLPVALLQLRLLPNAPNPFSIRTTISYQLPTTGQVELGVYNVAGQLISTLIAGIQQPGKHSATWNSAGVFAAGVYFYRLKFNGREQIRKMLLIK